MKQLTVMGGWGGDANGATLFSEVAGEGGVEYSVLYVKREICGQDGVFQQVDDVSVVLGTQIAKDVVTLATKTVTSLFIVFRSTQTVTLLVIIIRSKQTVTSLIIVIRSTQ